MKPFDLYHVDFPWRTSTYARWFLLVKQDGADWLCFGISSRDDDGEAFEVRDDDPDFTATGLNHISYIYDGDPYTRIPSSKLINRKGELTGDLLVEFRKATGC